MPLEDGGRARKGKEKQKVEIDGESKENSEGCNSNELADSLRTPQQYTGPDRSDIYADSSSESPQPIDLEPLSSRSLLALRNLARYGRRKARKDGSEYGWNEWPTSRRAAVMVALFGGRSGELNVLLSTRAMNLRTNVSIVHAN